MQRYKFFMNKERRSSKVFERIDLAAVAFGRAAGAAVAFFETTETSHLDAFVLLRRSKVLDIIVDESRPYPIGEKLLDPDRAVKLVDRERIDLADAYDVRSLERLLVHFDASGAASIGRERAGLKETYSPEELVESNWFVGRHR